MPSLDTTVVRASSLLACMWLAEEQSPEVGRHNASITLFRLTVVRIFQTFVVYVVSNHSRRKLLCAVSSTITSALPITILIDIC